MKKKIKSLFYNKLTQDLSQFNFLLLNCNIPELAIKNCSWIKRFNIRKNSYFLLEPQEIVKQFKQLFRIFSYIRKKTDYFIRINFDDTHFVEMFSNWVEKSSLDINKFLIKKYNIDFNVQNPSKSNINVFFSNNRIYYKRFFDNNCLIINEINLKWKTFYNSTYKIFNDIHDWKKLLFFFLIIKKNFCK
jgi:hypothetical protein